MGFRATQDSSRDDSWKAVGFMNFEIVQIIDGEEVVTKLGAIPLRQANDGERELAQWLASDEKHAMQLLSTLRLVYRSAEGKKRSLIPVAK